jgi:adenosine kinase
VKTICEFATAQDKPLGFNLSALFVVQFFMDAVKETIKHADYVFCNEDEGSAFASAVGLEATDRAGVAKVIAQYEKASATRPRIVIITQGGAPTIVATSAPGGEATIQLVDVPAIDQELIVDTNGAGDSFVGGFFAALAQGSDLITAVTKGNELARSVIQKSGCVFE